MPDVDTAEGQVYKKFALVIGNSYAGSDRVSGTKDAGAMALSLEELGFFVITVYDGNAKEIKAALKDLRTRIANAEVVLFFYSGHGYQLGGDNYLLPVGSAIDPVNPEVPMDKVLRSLSGAPDKAIKLVFLDACRSNADLPVMGGGTLSGVSGWSPGLVKPPQTTPPHTLFGYAAAYGQPAVSGELNGFSPYSGALLGSIREPGLEIRQLLARVHDQVFAITQHQQSPQEEGIASLPEGFNLYLSPPVFIHAESPGGHSDLLAILREKVVFATNQPVKEDLRLNAGDNNLSLLVSNGRTYHNNHDWSQTEGWNYQLNLTLPDGTVETFEGHEDVPFKVGPHHGKVFPVASVRIYVDPQTAEVKLLDRDTEIWNRQPQTPFWAQDQDLLFETSIASLNLTPEDILEGAVNLGGVAAILRPFLVEFLKSGTVLGAQIANPNTTFVTVRGNKALKELAEFCMTKRRDERIRDLKASIAATFNRNPTPFDLFDQGLMACMRNTAQNQGITIPTDDIRVWTALEDRSHGMPAIAVPAAEAVEADPILVPQG
jgi:hypothetical protein